MPVFVPAIEVIAVMAYLNSRKTSGCSEQARLFGRMEPGACRPFPHVDSSQHKKG